jgi:glycosyltransferase involved in cell wall biosynthesis
MILLEINNCYFKRTKVKILFAGKKGFDYNRVQILYNGLKSIADADVEIMILDKKNFDIKKFREIEKNFDVIYIPPFRPTDNRFLSKRATIPVIFDPLVSTFMTRVNDYKQYWKAPHKYFVDKNNFNSCDILIADTIEHKKYFSKKFKINHRKIFVLPIGVDFSTFKTVETPKKDNKFHVGFYGSFVPLQGVDKIIETANILKSDSSIIFEIIGDGYDMPKAQKIVEKNSLKNIIFHGRVEYRQLPDLISNFDITLGIFGSSLKTDVVIPNKIFHYSAQKKCTITKDTMAIREIFTDNENIILSSNNPQDIAEKILFCKKNFDTVKKIGNNAHKLISENYNEQKIAQKFIEICKSAKNLTI